MDRLKYITHLCLIPHIIYHMYRDYHYQKYNNLKSILDMASILFVPKICLDYYQETAKIRHGRNTPLLVRIFSLPR